MRSLRGPAGLVLLAALAVSACGVPPTGVIEAGEPAKGMPWQTDVYFLAGSALQAVSRQIPSGGDPVLMAVGLVFLGPEGPETQALTTRLPRLPGPPGVKTDGDDISVQLPEGVGPLDPLGVRQLVCTAAGTLRAASGGQPGSGTVTVRIYGTGWEKDQGDDACKGHWLAGGGPGGAEGQAKRRGAEQPGGSVLPSAPPGLRPPAGSAPTAGPAVLP